MSSSLRVSPPSGQLTPDGVLLVEEFADTPESLVAASELRLTAVDGREEITLAETERVQVQPRRVVTLLRPTKKLRPGMRYQLTREQKVLSVDSSWSVSTEPKAAETPPRWSSPPTVGNVIARHTSEGDGFEIPLTVSTSPHASAVKLVIEDPGHSTRMTDYRPVRDGQVLLSTGLCTDDYGLQSGGEYRLTLQPMGPSGALGEPLQLTLRLPKEG